MTLDHLSRAATHLAARLPDTCTVDKPETLGVLNSTTGLYSSPVPGANVFTGACSITQSVHRGGTTETAGQERQLESHLVRLPADAATPELGDIVTITASTLDADLIGQSFDVVGIRSFSHLVSKIIGVRSHERSRQVA